MIVQGIVFGLLAAVCQSFSYLFSRRFVARPGTSPWRLLALSHAWMGLFALAILPLCWDDRALAVASYAGPLVGACGAYLIGQFFFFRAVSTVEASRVSPLLGLKLPILALITTLLMQTTLTPLQWGAAALSLAAAVGLNYSGGTVPARALGVILLACAGFSISDLDIVELVRAVSPERSFRGMLLATMLTFVLMGAAAWAVVLAGPRAARKREDWRAALPMAAAWFTAMVCLYACFGLLGAVFGNIVQSLRGPLSVLLGAIVAAVGHVHLERRVDGWTIVRRVLAALLMCAAIGIFAAERRRVETERPLYREGAKRY